MAGPILFAPTDEAVLEATRSGGWTRLIEASRASRAVAVVLGAGAAAGERVTLDPSVLAIEVGLRTGLPVVVAVTPERDHPYNTARRILSADHLLGGRVGVLLGIGAEPAGPAPWTPVARDASLLAEFATVLREQWNSWPRESIIGDKESGRYADTSAIRAPLHVGAYGVAGPSTAWSSVQGEPPILSSVTLPDGLADLGPGEFAVARAADAADAADEHAESESLADASVTLREALGLAPRRLDTSGWREAFATGPQRGAA